MSGKGSRHGKRLAAHPGESRRDHCEGGLVQTFHRPRSFDRSSRGAECPPAFCSVGFAGGTPLAGTGGSGQSAGGCRTTHLCDPLGPEDAQATAASVSAAGTAAPADPPVREERSQTFPRRNDPNRLPTGQKDSPEVSGGSCRCPRHPRVTVAGGFREGPLAPLRRAAGGNRLADPGSGPSSREDSDSATAGRSVSQALSVGSLLSRFAMLLGADARSFSSAEEKFQHCVSCGKEMVILPEDQRRGRCFDCTVPLGSEMGPCPECGFWTDLEPHSVCPRCGHAVPLF